MEEQMESSSEKEIGNIIDKLTGKQGYYFQNDKSNAVPILIKKNNWKDSDYGFFFRKLDAKGRSWGSFVITKEISKVDRKNPKCSPSGWVANSINSEDANIYLINKGHLVSDQLGGSNHKENIITSSVYLNTGGYDKTDINNTEAMRFYEENLVKWLKKSSSYLFYKVTPCYLGNELVPRSVTLEFFGIDQEGNEIEIELKDQNNVNIFANLGDLVGVKRVISLDNEINYKFNGKKYQMIY